MILRSDFNAPLDTNDDLLDKKQWWIYIENFWNNHLYFHAVGRKVWPNKKLAPLIGVGPHPLGNRGSAPEKNLYQNIVYAFA